MSKPFKRANDLARQVFEDFMQQVVEQHVLHERVSPVREVDKLALEQGKIINLDAIRLMSISGKGGYCPDPEKFTRYSENMNITLLDHVLSVTRGALMLAVLSWLQADPEMDEAAIIERLMVLAVTAFLHDLDKMLQLPRNEALTLEHVEDAIQRYGLSTFLGDIQLTAEQVRFLIEQVETSQAFRHPCSVEPKRAYSRDARRYAQLADKLDGLWCAHGAEAGLDAVVEYMQSSTALADEVLIQWRAVDIFDPHHPFLLDELQRNLSFACRRESGIPPLLETHQDGHLCMLLPASHWKTVLERGIKGLLNSLPFVLEMIISNRGIPELRNGQPYLEQYVGFIEQLDRRELGRLFLVSNRLIDDLTQAMDESLAVVGLQPRWASKITGQLSSPYPNPDELDYQALQALLKAAQLTLLLNLKLPVSKKNDLPDYSKREQQLLKKLDIVLPDWLEKLDDTQSKRVLMGVWVVAATHNDSSKQALIWGEEGLLQNWLEGTEEQAGFNQYFAGEGVEALKAIRRHFEQLMQQQRVTPEDESVSGRCLFTDAPAQTLISSSLNLYEVKVSAFTGREGKPDSITAPAKGEVPISLVSLAEHKLRQEAFAIQGGKPSGVPTLVSSPITTGLFGALILDDSTLFKAFSSYDLNRKKMEQGKANYRGLEIYRYRYRLARLERIPERTEDQIQTLRLLLQGCLRVGRPLHLFRGLPTPQKAFFYFDAMPRILQHIIGSNELRLEEIPLALKQLEIAETISSAAGLGYDVLTMYALLQTRFATCALVWGYVEDRLEDKKLSGSMHYLQIQMIQSQQESEMSEQDGALVRLGQAATVIQYMPTKHTHSEELLVFNLCLDTAMGLLAMQQRDRSSLINGIADQLSINLKRKSKEGFGLYREDKLDEACLTFAEQFVDEVWFEALGGKPPAQKEKRLLSAIYRMAFIQAHRQAHKQRKAEKAAQIDTTELTETTEA